MSDRLPTTGGLTKQPEVLRLQNEFAIANAECTSAMNRQFLALVNGEDIEPFNEPIAKAEEKRRRAMEALLNHIRMHGWK